MKIAFFGSSLLSAYWNGAATYYRGMIRALHGRGHSVTFYEPDAYERQSHRDLDPPDWASVVVYPNALEEAERCLDTARGSDLIIKASGVGVFDEWLEAAIPACRTEQTRVAFWDVDAPATLQRIFSHAEDAFRAQIPRYDLVLTYGGGPRVIDEYRQLGARDCIPIYNALDPATHHPVEPVESFASTLAFLGNRLPDREARVHEFFLRAATLTPGESFLLGGNGWHDLALPPNVRYAGHVYTADHNALNCSARAVLNISRESMADYGHSPATRVFEAAGSGACIITDHWQGIGEFFKPGREILVARNGEEVAAILGDLSPERAREIGAAARRRALAEHTYDVRARQFEFAVGKLGLR